MLRIIAVFFCVSSLTVFSFSFRKFDGGSLKVPSCEIKYAKDDCTGEVLGAVQPDAAVTVQGNTKLYENQAAIMVSNMPGNYYRCLATECGTHGHQFNVSCDDWCKSIGHSSGEHASARPAGNDCPAVDVRGAPFLSAYCACNAKDDLDKIVDRLVVIDGKESLEKDKCLPVVYELRNHKNKAIEAPSELQVWFGTTAPIIEGSKPPTQSGRFYDNEKCEHVLGKPFGWVFFKKGQSQIKVWFKDSQAGDRKTRATINGFEPVKYDFKVK